MLKLFPVYKIKVSIKQSSNSEVVLNFSDSITPNQITYDEMTIEISSSYSVTFSWTAEFIDSNNLKIKLNIQSVLTGNEVMSIKLNGWKTFRGK